jgi:hypothetical protein
MKKTVIVINGAGGVGKDTMCNLASKHFKVRNISTITPIKELASLAGWDGRKDDKSRRFLSDLKQLCVDYNDFPTNWAKGIFDEFMQTDEDILFVHIREPEEIAKFIKATNGFAKALLVRGGDRMKKSHYGNRSDDEVENYKYDYYFYNDKSLDVAEKELCQLLKDILS